MRRRSNNTVPFICLILALLPHNHRPTRLREVSNLLPIFVSFCCVLLGGPPPPTASQSASVNIPGGLPSSTPYTMPPEPTLSQNPLSIMMSRMSKFAMPSSTPLYHDAIKTVASSDDDSPPARSPNLPSMNNMPGKTSGRWDLELTQDKRSLSHVFSTAMDLSRWRFDKLKSIPLKSVFRRIQVS